MSDHQALPRFSVTCVTQVQSPRPPVPTALPRWRQSTCEARSLTTPHQPLLQRFRPSSDGCSAKVASRRFAMVDADMNSRKSITSVGLDSSTRPRSVSRWYGYLVVPPFLGQTIKDYRPKTIKFQKYHFQIPIPIPLENNQKKLKYRYGTGKCRTLRCGLHHLCG